MATEPQRAARHPGARLLAPVRVIRARPQLFVSAVIGLAAFTILPPEMRPFSRGLVGWNIGLLFYFALVASLISSANHAAIRQRARMLDEGGIMILMLTTAIACASFGAIIVELGALRDVETLQKHWNLILTIVTVVNSWLFLHLTFALHYAHEYYLDEEDDGGKTRAGLLFPETESPRYIDFLYFSYTIGVSCATSDVEVCTREFRGTVLIHALLAFFFNTMILALLVNIGSNII
jgi:uncharacterized membrane protein